MRRLHLREWLLAFGLLLPAASASAQGDVRDIRPAVMLLMDTSGSMERLPGCACASEDDCASCVPDCEATPDARSKWNVVLEALTGQWTDQNFACEAEDRPSGAYDTGYAIPHFIHPDASVQQGDGLLDEYRQRVLFGLMTFDVQPTWDGVSSIMPATQWNVASSNGAAGHFSNDDPKDYTYCGGDGVTYRMDVGARYGGLVGPLVSTGTGTDSAAVNDAIQAALLGRAPYDDLRPYGGTPLAGMLSDYQHYLDHHVDMQVGGTGDPFLACRPRYAVIVTDGAPNLDMRGGDFPCDDVTSGGTYRCPYPRPDELVAALCNAEGGQCTGDVDGVFVVGFDVPDDATRELLNDLADVGGTESAYFATSAADLRAKLGAILSLTGLTAPGVAVTSRTPPVFTTAKDGFHAQYTSGYRAGAGGAWEGILERRRYSCSNTDVPAPVDINETDRFHEVLTDQTSRTLYTVLPAEACDVRGHLTGDVPTNLAPFGFSGTSSNGGRGGARPNTGGANTSCGRDRGTVCTAATPPPVDPYEASACGRDRGNRPQSNAADETGLDLVPFTTDNTKLTAQYFFFPQGSTGGGGRGPHDQTTGTSTTDEDDLIRWVRAEGSSRTNALGAIQHSTPVVVGRPEQIADESHELFRRRTGVADRPVVLYFGTSDGILHCISATEQTVGGVTYEAGQELWGFVPPVLLPNLQVARSNHHPMMDGTPVVRDVFSRRVHSEPVDGAIYQTILISGFRAGGAGYFALDVTDPRHPKFLWQFSHPEMGYSYGQPAIAQVAVQVGTGTDLHIEERAVALLPAGGGEDLTGALGCGKCYICGGTPQLEAPTATQLASGSCTLSEPIGCPSSGIGRPPANTGTVNALARAEKRCWGTQGRHLFFVDPVTGALVGHLDDTIFGAPLVGGMAVFPGDTGTVASAAYTTDADGVIWRIDMSSPDMTQWGAAPIFDMFWGESAADGQPAFEAPVVTTDPLGNVVVIQATGNLDVYDSLVTNKVVSITERFSVSTSTNQSTGTVGVNLAQVGADLNWQVTLRPSEQVTGPLTLFDQQVFFATFTGVPNASNACAVGESRIWGLHYIDNVDPHSGTIPDEHKDTNNQCISQLPVTVGTTTEASDNIAAGVLWPIGVFTGAGNANTGAGGRCLGPYENMLVLGAQVAQRSTCFDLGDQAFRDPFIGASAERTRTTESSGGTFELVATSTGGTPVGGASLGQVTRQIEVPIPYTRATGSYAGRAD